VAARIKKVGGSGGQGLIGAAESVVGEVAGKTVAAVKGQVGTARAILTEQAETQLRNVQEERREEHVEIAVYTRINVFATEVGDRETALLALAPLDGPLTLAHERPGRPARPYALDGSQDSRLAQRRRTRLTRSVAAARPAAPAGRAALAQRVRSATRAGRACAHLTPS
jgi:hypothetical protein